jgi:hypothetical protein
MAYLSGCRRKGKHPFRPGSGMVLLHQIAQQRTILQCSIPMAFAAKIASLCREDPASVKYYR